MIERSLPLTQQSCASDLVSVVGFGLGGFRFDLVARSSDGVASSSSSTFDGVASVGSRVSSGVGGVSSAFGNSVASSSSVVGHGRTGFGSFILSLFRASGEAESSSGHRGNDHLTHNKVLSNSPVTQTGHAEGRVNRGTTPLQPWPLRLETSGGGRIKKGPPANRQPPLFCRNGRKLSWWQLPSRPEPPGWLPWQRRQLQQPCRRPSKRHQRQRRQQRLRQRCQQQQRRQQRLQPLPSHRRQHLQPFQQCQR